MNNPHKHCEVIKAWADGAEIQVKDPHTDKWSPLTERPYWYEDMQYRVKPKTIRYRVALLNKANNEFGTTTVNAPHEEQCVQGWGDFAYWLTDWIKVEV